MVIDYSHLGATNPLISKFSLLYFSSYATTLNDRFLSVNSFVFTSFKRGYPTSLLDSSFFKASQIPRSETPRDPVTDVTDNNKIPLVLAFYPFNFKVRDLIINLENCPETSAIFSDNPLVSFRHSKNIRDILVNSNLPQESSPLFLKFFKPLK